MFTNSRKRFSPLQIEKFTSFQPNIEGEKYGSGTAVSGDRPLLVMYYRTSCELNFHGIHDPFMEDNGNYSAAVMHPEKNIRVGLGCHRLASDHSALHRRELGRSPIWDDKQRPGRAGLKVEDENPYHRGRGRQKPKKGFPVSGILLMSYAKRPPLMCCLCGI